MTEGMNIEADRMGAADVLTALDSHGAGMVVKGHVGLRMLPGRAVVEEIPRRKSVIITMKDNDNDEKWYRGRVLAMGPPGVTPRSFDGEAWVGGAEVPWGCKVGDEVLFEPHLWLDKMRTYEFFGVRGRVWIVGQVEVMAVVE
jgi:hypothetical protein